MSDHLTHLPVHQHADAVRAATDTRVKISFEAAGAAGRRMQLRHLIALVDTAQPAART